MQNNTGFMPCQLCGKDLTNCNCPAVYKRIMFGGARGGGKTARMKKVFKAPGVRQVKPNRKPRGQR